MLNPPRRIWLLGLVAAAGATLMLLFYFVTPTLLTTKSQIHSAPIQAQTPASLPKQEQTAFGLPLRFKIPAIGVDTVIENMSLTAEGAMDTPKNLAHVGWYERGPRPGENGSAVITGHYGGTSVPAVFNSLSELKPGDTISIEDERGITATFAVRASQTYDPQADASDVFNSTDGKAHLNLITCEGVWNNSSQSYSKRLVVFADKE